MDRTILHCDLNGFYAAVECFYHPELRPFPVAVAGDPELRHGIILAKNGVAKQYNIKTGEAIWQAREKCPELIIVKPHHALYQKHSRLAREIYTDYSDRVESFGPDECWVDLSGRVERFEDGKRIADEIRGRIREELGITASVGVSFNKVFAKLGSDYKKPDATTVISRENYREIVWPLAANEMIYIGQATTRKLARFGVHTLGQLADTDPEALRGLLGKNGVMLWRWANGQDYAPVRQYQTDPPVKSIGNSTTAPRDIVTEQDAKITLHLLCESVASRMREQGRRCNTVQLQVRDAALYTYERQAPLPYPTGDAQTIFRAAFALLSRHNLREHPVRSLGVRACALEEDRVTQLSIFPEMQRVQRQEELERAVDGLRDRFGAKIVQRGLMLTDRQLSAVNPKGDHLIHPESYFR